MKYKNLLTKLVFKKIETKNIYFIRNGMETNIEMRNFFLLS